MYATELYISDISFYLDTSLTETFQIKIPVQLL